MFSSEALTKERFTSKIPRVAARIDVLVCVGQRSQGLVSSLEQSQGQKLKCKLRKQRKTNISVLGVLNVNCIQLLFLVSTKYLEEYME